MAAEPSSLAATLADFGPTAILAGTHLAAALTVFLIAAALLRSLRDKRVISRSLAGLVKWLVALGLLFGLERSLPADLRGKLAIPFTVTYLAAAWMMARHGVDFLYAQLFIARGKGQPGRHILKDLIKFLALVVLAGAGLKQLLDIQLSSLLTSSAILTAVIGLSMQDTIGSLISGLLLQTEKPFQEGDWIKVGDVEGRVTEVTWRYTKVVTLGANEVLLPNNAVAKERLVNYNRPAAPIWRTAYIPAPPEMPPVEVKSAILTALSRAEGVARTPPPSVRLAEIHPDRLVYAAVYAITSFNAGMAAADAVLSAVWYQFLERGIDLPPPTRRVFLEERTDRVAPPERSAALAEVELLAGMTEEDRDMLARASVKRRFSAGQTIFAKGETGTTMCIILSGQVAIIADGRELARLGPGQIFGEMALLTGEPRQADVRAVEPTQCLEVDREGFRMVLARHPEIVDRVRQVFRDRAGAKPDASSTDDSAEAGTLFARFKKLFL